LSVDATPTGGNVVVIEAEAIAGQTLTLGNGSTVTVLGDTVQHTGVAGPKNLETAIITPNPGAAVAKKTNLTINPSTAGSYSEFTGGTVSTSAATVVVSGADFAGDVGQPVTVTYLDTTSPYDGYFNPFSPPQSPASPAVEYSFISAVGGVGNDTITVSENEAPAGTAPSSAVESLDSQVNNSAAVVTVGSTAQVTSTVGTDYDFALTGCQASNHATTPGDIFPNNVTFTNTGPVSNPSAAVGLESGVKPINGADVNFPSGLPAGYSWADSEPPTGYSAGGAGGNIQVSFDSLKDTLNLNTDAETFVDGTVPSGEPYTTSKAAMSFGVGSMVICTDAQLQAIGTGSGGSGIDSVAGPHHVPAAANAGAVGADALANCDGGTNSSLTSTQAFDELALVEADPNGGGAGSDGTGLGAIWQVGGTGTATF
jgi:hypothetical protein